MSAAHRLLLLLPLALMLSACRAGAQEETRERPETRGQRETRAGNCDTSDAGGAVQENAMTRTIQKSDEEWRGVLTPDQYRVLRQKGTEAPFTGAYEHNEREGVYVCAGCGAVLFASDAKFDSGSGWPSFTAPADSTHIEEATDSSHGMLRSEVRCRNCGGHLGHVFDDGPAPTGLRYCINSASLTFRPGERKK